MSGRVVPLGELCDMDRRGIRPDDPLASRLPFVGVENVGSGTGRLNFDTESRTGSRKSVSLRFDSRHVLYAKLRPYLNKVATPGFAGRCSTELVPLLPRAGVDRAFLAYLLRRGETVAFVMASATGARMPRADMKVLLSMPVSVPPLDEQRRIAGILDRAARIARLRAQAADRLRAFAPALFVKMFGAPAENPMGWEVAGIDDVCTVIGGGTPRRSNEAYFGGPIPWATPTDATALTDLFIARTKESITETGLRESSARLLPAGAVLLTSRATIGYTAIAARPMATNQGFANLICGDRLTPEYVACWLRARRDLLQRMAGGTTFKEISKSTLKGIEIPLPPLTLQRTYARILEMLRGISAGATAASENASLLTDSLMDRLLASPTAQRKRGITCSP